MGTSNFYNENATKIYSKFFEDDFEYGIFVEDLISILKERFGVLHGFGNDEYELRSYPSKVIGTILKEVSYKGINVTLCLTIILRSGYYEGVNLDWSRSFDFYFDEFESLEGEKDYIIEKLNEDGENVNEELFLYLNKEMNIFVEELESLYETITIPLNVVARFSNGETIYAKC